MCVVVAVLFASLLLQPPTSLHPPCPPLLLQFAYAFVAFAV
jgi:hypothetical protein